MRAAFAIPRVLCGLLLVLVSGALAQVPVVTEKIALSGETDPFSGNLPRDLQVFRLQEDGAVLFYPQDLSTRLYAGTLAGVTRRLGAGARGSDGKAITDFQLSAGNKKGQIALLGFKAGQANLYLLTGSVLQLIAEVDTMVGTFGPIEFFDPPALDAAGHLAFHADDSNFSAGLFFADSTVSPVTPVKIAVLGDLAPDGNAFTDFDSTVALGTGADGKVTVYFNASTAAGDGLYAAQIAGGSAPVIHRVAAGLHQEVAVNSLGQAVYHDASQLYLADFNGSTAFAQVGGPYTAFEEAVLNDAGLVVFKAATGSGEALFVKSAAGIAPLAQVGQPFGDATLSALGDPQIDPSGFIAFDAQLTRTTGTTAALFLANGGTLLKAAEGGDAVAGSTFTSLSLALAPDALNGRGQLAFKATLANGKSGVFLATPASHPRVGGPGVWESPLTWDFGLVPTATSPVALDSASDAVVRGPAAGSSVHVRSLKVGGGTGTTTLQLQAGSMLTAQKGVQIADHGVLAGSGEIGTGVTLLPGSRLLLDLAGPTRTGEAAYDFLRLDGVATFDGTLQVTTSGGFQPTRAQSFDLLDFGTHKGKFATLALAGLNPAALTWDSTQLYTKGVLAVSGAQLFAATQGTYTGTLQGSPSVPATSGAVQLTIAANGRLTGTLAYAGKTFALKTTTLNVDGSGSVSFGTPAKVLQVQLSTVNQVPQIAASVSTNAVAESQATAARTDAAFSTASPFYGHYTVALPPDPAHPEAAFPRGTGYGVLSVSAHGLAKLTGVLGDGTAFSAGGPLTAAGEFPFYASAYSAKGFVEGRLTLHAATADSALEGTLRWYKPATAATSRFPAVIDATVTVLGSGFQSPPTRPAVLSFTGGHATFQTSGTPDKAVTLDSHNAFHADSGEAFSLSFPAASFGLGTGSFRDAGNVAHAIKGVALQKQNVVFGEFVGVNQTGTFEVK